MTKKPLVVFHGPGCLDGMAAAWCMWQLFGEKAEYIVGQYQLDDPIDFADRDVYLVDFSYPLVMMQNVILPLATRVFLLDHHKKALEELEVLRDHPKFDMSWATLEKSGAMIAWDFVVNCRVLKRLPSQSKPALLELIQDRDLWKFAHKETKPVTTALYAKRDLDFRTIDKYMELEYTQLDTLLKEGTVLLDAHMKECEVLVKIAKRTFLVYTSNFDAEGNFEGETLHEIQMVNAPPKYSSDIGNMLSEEYGIGGTYYDTVENRVFSLRSNGDFDVDAIARKFGGGGHARAAGFKVARWHYLAKW